MENKEEEAILDIEVLGHEIINKKPFYKIRIKKSGKIICAILKSYENFKELHEDLKVIAKKKNEIIEDLPNKGNLGLFANENKIIEFRVFALQVYLKYLMNHPIFKQTDSLRAFLGML